MHIIFKDKLLFTKCQAILFLYTQIFHLIFDIIEEHIPRYLA